MNYKSKSNKSKSVAFYCELIDENHRQIDNKIFSTETVFKGEFIIASQANVDMYYQVILINNYKQVNFSINEGVKSRNHTIYIPKSQNQFYKTKISITSKLEKGFNDCLMIFMEKQKGTEDDDGIIRKIIFDKRFTAMSEDTILKRSYNKISNNYEAVSNNFNLSLAINAELRKDTNELIPAIQLFIEQGEKSLREIPIAISLKNSIIGSPFFNQYVEDENSNQKQTIAVLAISDGKILPLYYSTNRKDDIQFYNINLGKTILIRPKIDPDDLYNNKKISFFVIPYPYENVNNLFKTYKITNWSTVIKETIKIILV